MSGRSLPFPRQEILRLMQAKDWNAALQRIDEGLRSSPADVRWLMSRAQCLLAMGRPADASKAAAAARRDAPPDAALFDAIGNLFSQANDQPQALSAFARAVELAPDNPHYLFNRATVARFMGKLAESEADYERVIALRPDDYEAYKNRTELRTQRADSNHVEQLERLLAGGIADWRGDVQIRYALAKEYEDLGDFEKSFQHLELGARRRREHLRYDVAVDVLTVDWIMEAFPAATGADTAPAAGGRDGVSASPPVTDSPIFVIGLPRSGTTLVDRILGSHPGIVCAGELNHFAYSIVDAVKRSVAAEPPRRELIARSATLDFAALGRDYLQRAHDSLSGQPPPARRFTDKMPLNYLYCGLIRRALPNARIVHVARHPMAVCYAMYKTLFKDGYPFSYDLDDIGRYYVAYRRLMEHWCATTRGIHTVHYEALISDQETQTRRLLEFCGLDWQPACLEFHRNPAPTTTASAAQVRRPVYGSSVSQWRHYARQLTPLSERLQRAGIDVA